MGVDINTYRQRIGCFSTKQRLVSALKTLHIPINGLKRFMGCLRLVICLTSLLIMCGDIESNPGPGPGPGPRMETRASKQPTLSFFGDSTPIRSQERQITSTPTTLPMSSQFSQQGQGQGKGKSGQDKKKGSIDPELMAFLQNMKSEFTDQFASLNTKMDNICFSIKSLQDENEALRKDNEQMKSKMDNLCSKIDALEGHSRRNNLRFGGIPGKLNEQWSETESRVRSFISNELNKPELENVDIERAHRIKSNDPNKCTIIVKFTKYKERDQILKSAKILKGSDYYVKEDFTNRVKECRRRLGVHLKEARDKGLFATMNFDKLIIENDVFKYDEETQQIKCIGRAKGNSISRDARANIEREVTNQPLGAEGNVNNED